MVENGSAVGVTGAQAAVIEVERAVLVDHAHHVGARFAKAVVKLRLRLVELLDQADRFTAPLDDPVDLVAEFVALALSQRLVHAAGNDPGAVDALAGNMADDFLPEFAGQHALSREIGIGAGDADDVALGDLAGEAKQQVGRGRWKKCSACDCTICP